METKPLVPLSSFDASTTVTTVKNDDKIAVEKVSEIALKPSSVKSLVEVIDDNGTDSIVNKKGVDVTVGEKIEALNGLSVLPSSLLLLQPAKEVKLTENAPVDGLPVITKKNPNLSDMMKQGLSSLRISHEEKEEDFKLTSDERSMVMSIKNINITIPSEKLNTVLFSLVDILCAYSYDVRLTQHDATPESAWTISILSPTLSWLVPSSSLNKVIIAFIRRVVIYPYLRRYDLARLCIKDCCCILKLGKRRILKCLLDIKKIMKSSERKYILNTLYIDKYILWIQTVDYSILYDVADEINYQLSNCINRDVLGLGIPELDEKGKEMLKEEAAELLESEM